MIRENAPFRPWGQLGMILDGIGNQRWSFLGCISMEDRSVSVYSHFQNLGCVGNTLIFELINQQSRYYDELKIKSDANLKTFQQLDLSGEDLISHNLKEPFGYYTSRIDHFLNEITENNLVIDITSMPKRLFFYLIRQATSLSDKTQNIVVTYTEPESYGKNALAENSSRWAPLPGFSGPRKYPLDRKVVIGIGFEPLGLPELVISGEFESAKISLLFPFPSPPDRVTKNWKFIRDLFPNVDTDGIDIRRVDGTNLPEIFDAIGRIGDFGETHVTLAPFGPKPVSLAMALYANRYSGGKYPTSVFYTQPSVYNPNYSNGTKMLDGAPVIHSYCIRINGNNLY